MKFKLVFLLSSYLLIFFGFAGLIYTGELSHSYVVITGLSLVAGMLIDTRASGGFLPTFVANIAMVVIFALTVFSIFVLRSPPIQELVHFLLALQAVKVLTPKRSRDWLQLYLLSFFSVVASSALSVEISFAAIFVCYLFLAPWVLILLQLKEATDLAGKEPDTGSPLINFSLVRWVGSTAMALFVLTLFFFITFPRLSVRLFADTWSSGSATTGFSDLMTLGQVAEIQKNGAVAMRVSVDRSKIATDKRLYWRGIALDHFDGQRWQRSKTDSTLLQRRGETYLARENALREGALLRQNIVLEPNGSAALFILGRAITVSGRLGNLYRDSLANLRLAYPFPVTVSYEAVSDTRESWSDESSNATDLQLPSLDSRIGRLAQSISDEADGEEKRAYALERFLKETYRYSLEGLPVGSAAPLSAFLFDARQGNCEYFSSALAVMLRSVGIPARVVNGYLGGEWNPYGEYYLIRQTDAHSWVEAYVRERGWVTLDPTPPLPLRARTRITAVSHFFDYLQMRWYRYVVNFGFADQYRMLGALRQPNHWFDVGLRALSLEELKPPMPSTLTGWLQILLGSLGVVFGLALALQKYLLRRLSLSANPCIQASARYERFLTLLNKKRSVTKRIGETPDEFSRRAAAAGITCAHELTTLYQSARFSGKQMDIELKRMDEILAELKKI